MANESGKSERGEASAARTCGDVVALLEEILRGSREDLLEATRRALHGRRLIAALMARRAVLGLDHERAAAGIQEHLAEQGERLQRSPWTAQDVRDLEAGEDEDLELGALRAYAAVVGLELEPLRLARRAADGWEGGRP